jgi:selenide,water dikinase
LDLILGKLNPTAPTELLVGFETGDDGGVYRLDSERAVVSTADFITPVVDDPFAFGAVAAANSLSDIYAMGARPLLALNLMGYPPKEVPAEVLGEILAGAAAKCDEAGCAVAGGHSVRDSEIKFGLAVTGLVHPDRILRNGTAQAGDHLVLTKPLGTGALVAATKAGKLSPNSPGFAALLSTMTTLNKAGLLLADLGANAATDVTGFGLTGHALEMARAGGLCFVIDTNDLPLLPEAVALCGAGFTCGGTQANAAFTDAHLLFSDGISEDMKNLLHDPQTSGGLLIAVPPNHCSALVEAILADGALCAAVIGQVRRRKPSEPYLKFTS